MHGLCRLQDAVGRVEACPGDPCLFWDPGQGSCVFVALAGELPSRPDLAQYLLELRHELDHARAPAPAERPRTLFYRLPGGDRDHRS